MSRPTSSEVIDSGKYLEDNFDPATLTIPHLTAILNYHEIPKPPQSNKGKLIQSFMEEIYPRRQKYRRERAEMEGSEASAAGISDGMTGEPIDEFGRLRRSTRASSRGVSIEPTPAPPPSKRRRSASEQPTQTGGQPSKYKSNGPAQPTLVEESEEDEEPVPKIARQKSTTSTVASSKRRVSDKIGTGTEDSPWEDSNIFQSGNESSSPLRIPKSRPSSSRPKPVKRSSMSAPPESSPSSSPIKTSFPTADAFNPTLGAIGGTSPRSMFREPPSSPLARKPGQESLQAQRQLFNEVDESADVSLMDDLAVAEPQTKLEKYNTAVDEQMGSKAVVKRTTKSARSRVPIFWPAVIISALSLITPYKIQSQSIGFCDANSSTNSILEDIFRERQEKAKFCDTLLNQIVDKNFQDQPKVETMECVFFNTVPFRPETCTPCPKHADCTPSSVTCHKSFALKPNLISQIPFADQTLNGLPFLGSIALSPTCIVDETVKRRISVIGRDINALLTRDRGDKVCAKGKLRNPSVEKQVQEYGMDVLELRRRVHNKYGHARKGRGGKDIPAMQEDEFTDTFYNALHELVNVGALIKLDDVEIGDHLVNLVTSQNEEFGLQCHVKLWAHDVYMEYRRMLAALASLVVAIAALRNRQNNKRIESSKVSDLVAASLDQLRQQEMSHYVDPVTIRQPWLSPVHLRDLVLRDLHSVSARKNLWDKVERVVENNANVRVNMEESQGEEIRVWRWVGGGESQFNTPRKQQ